MLASPPCTAWCWMAYRCGADGAPTFVEVSAPADDELHASPHTVIDRLMKMLTRWGVLVEDMGADLPDRADADGEKALTKRRLHAAAITHRIAFAPRVANGETRPSPSWRRAWASSPARPARKTTTASPTRPSRFA